MANLLSFVFFVGLYQLCEAGAMVREPFNTLYCDADYAFKFQIVSKLKVRRECKTIFVTKPRPTTPSPTSDTTTQTPMQSTMSPGDGTATGHTSTKVHQGTKSTSVPTTTIENSTTPRNDHTDTNTHQGTKSTSVPTTTILNGTTTGYWSTGHTDTKTHQGTKSTSAPTTTIQDGTTTGHWSTGHTATKTHQGTKITSVPTTTIQNGTTPRNGYIDTNTHQGTKSTSAPSYSSSHTTIQNVPYTSVTTDKDGITMNGGSSPQVTTTIPGRQKRQMNDVYTKQVCSTLYEHEIRIPKRHIYKGLENMKIMDIVVDSNAKFYTSYITKRLNFNQRLMERERYLFVGNAIPGGETRKHSFFVSELSIYPWMKVKKLRRKFSKKMDRETCMKQIYL